MSLASIYYGDNLSSALEFPMPNKLRIRNRQQDDSSKVKMLVVGSRDPGPSHSRHPP